MSEILWGPTCNGRCGLAPGDHRHGTSTGGNSAYGLPQPVTAQPAGELREQIAETLEPFCVFDNYGGYQSDEDCKAESLCVADALLSGPLAPLLAKLRAVEECYRDGRSQGYVLDSALRRALDAES